MPTRIPVWQKPPVENVNFVERQWFWILIVAAGLVAGVFFYFAPRLPDAWLFYLKVFSFSATALLGVVGIVTDFKDEKKKLTTAGRLNLAGLVFAAIVGIVAQRAENSNAKKVAEAAKRQFEELIGKNNDVLEQVARNLEPIGDTVLVNYHAQIPLSQFESELLQLSKDDTGQIEMLNEHLAKSASRYNVKMPVNPGLPFAGFAVPIADVHTLPFVDKKGKVISVMFDRESSFVTDEITKAPSFVLVIYKTKPEFDRLCLAKEDLRFSWDKNQQRTEAHAFDSVGKKFDDVTFTYQPNSILEKLSEVADDSKFKLSHSSGALLSVLDLSGSYVQMLSTKLIATRFYTLSVKVGGRELKVDVRKPVGEGCYARVYRLPEFGTKSLRPRSN